MTTTSTINDEFAVTDWDHYVGQEEIKTRLELATTSAHSRQARLDHVFLDGPPGAGKSTLASLIAQRMDEPLVTIGKPPTVKELWKTLRDHPTGAILLCDEIHTWPKPTLNAMLPLAEAGSFNDWEFPFATLVAATTNPESLDGALLDRFPYVCRYQPYPVPDMARITSQFGERANIDLGPLECLAYGTAAGGSPRAARGFVITARDLIEAKREPTIERVLQLCRRYPDGLSYEHVDYLRILDRNGRRAGLDTLSMDLGMHRSLITQLERLLVARGMIRRETTGRELTPTGMARLMEDK